jgi:hypothetical protein
LPCAAQPSPPSLKKFDAGAFIGHFHAGLPRDEEFFYDISRDAVLGTVAGGFYWTEHIKTDIEWGRTSEIYSTGAIAVDRPDVPSYFRLYTRNETTTNVVSLAQSYQFFHNAWFHPYLTGGVDLLWDHTDIEVPEQRFSPSAVFGPGGVIIQPAPPPIVFPAQPDKTIREFSAHAFGGGGFKAYFTPRAFFRTDLRIGIGERSPVVARVGFGADF